MKRIILLVVALFLVFSLFSCEEPQNQKLDEIATTVENETQLSAQLGFEITLPENVRGVTFENINGTIAQLTFSYEGFFFTYRASKIYSSSQLFGIYLKPVNESTFIIGDDVSATVFDFKDGSRTVEWYENGVYKSLTCKKYIAESWFSQLCEQM